MNQANETDPIATLALAGKLLASMVDVQATSGEKAAALRTAAFAIEQAAQAQSMAVVMSNIIKKSGAS